MWNHLGSCYLQAGEKNLSAFLLTFTLMLNIKQPRCCSSAELVDVLATEIFLDY